MRMQGYAVTEVSDPAEGARMALVEPPAAVVADLSDDRYLGGAALPASQSRAWADGSWP